MQDATVSPGVTLTTVHPKQMVALQILGTNFDVNSTVLGNNGDSVGNPTITNSTTMSLSYLASSSLGTHTLTVQNPNGTSASASFQVATSVPAVTAIA